MHEDSQRFQGNVLPVSEFAKIVCKNEENKKQIKKSIATICWVIESES